MRVRRAGAVAAVVLCGLLPAAPAAGAGPRAPEHGRAASGSGATLSRVLETFTGHANGAALRAMTAAVTDVHADDAGLRRVVKAVDLVLRTR
ncbi:hypothetical protein [Actinomadura roseirufa]|uniref:hypothetical protein n=1 Tax=Actinomadura roseirufa TaxID=2094049 RepID=UPI0010411143|nr:hypothetical protein [Actinomadura roseirufa]